MVSLKVRLGRDSRHLGAARGAHWDAGRVEIVEAIHVDTEMVGCTTLAMEWIDAAGLAKKMMRRLCVKLILGERFGAGQQRETAFMHLDHQRILFAANRTVARRQFREVGVDFEADGAAVATAGIAF